MSSTKDRLFYPIQRALAPWAKEVSPQDYDVDAAVEALATELAAENLVLASREDIRLAVEVAMTAGYGDQERPLPDELRKRIDNLAAAIFTELERSA